MALTDQQRPLLAAILEGGDPLARWSEPWDVDRGDDLMQGGYPLKVTGERWDRRNADRLRIKAENVGIEIPTWLTADEIAALGTRPGPWSRQVEIETFSGKVLVYNAGDIRGLPARLYGTFWEIHPVNSDARHPGFDRFAASLDVEIRHVVVRATGRTFAEYDPITNVIHLPPFEMFYSAHDYYLSLAHELVHWAEANTDLVESILPDPAADHARHELVSEFGATFLVAEKGVADMPHPRSAAYVRTWRDKGSLSNAEVIHAAEDAARVIAWLSHEAPACRIIAGAAHPPPSESGRHPHHSRSTPRPYRASSPEALAEAASARRFVADALELESSIGGKDRDAWDRKAAHLLEQARHIDLDRPRVVAAIEAAVALETPLGVSPPSATAWLEDIRARMTRVLDMRRLTKDAQEETDVSTRGPRFSP